jgi:hypothetical protein
MPRRSAASYVSVVPGERPSPPDGLSEPELAIWHELTSSLPPERLDAAFVTLGRALVQHIRYARHLGDVMDKVLLAEHDPKQLRRLLTAHAMQTGKMADLMGRLRLLPVNRFVRDSAKLRPSTGTRPWLDWGQRSGN